MSAAFPWAWPLTSTIYVANDASGTVSVISGRTNLDPLTAAAYVTNALSNTVSVITN
jgi:DNA-binding beta-propeller fold protein YncE